MGFKWVGTGWDIKGRVEGNAFPKPVSGQAILGKCLLSSGMYKVTKADPWPSGNGDEV